MIAKHLQSEPIPPSQRTTKSVSPGLERLILKCLAKAPIERPQSAAQLAQALEFIPAEPWGEDQARRWWENNARRPIPRARAELPI
jgi:serine/threonine protein kinase